MAQANSAKPKVTVPTDSESIISMILGAMVVVVIGALLFSYFRSWKQNQADMADKSAQESSQDVIEVTELPSEVMTETDENGREVPTNLPAKYTVQEGDSTWKIAEAFYGSGFNYIDIEEANSLEAEQELVAGMQLTIPKVSVRSSNEAGVMRTEMIESVHLEEMNNAPTSYETKGGLQE